MEKLKAKKILTVHITSLTCENCKNNPCLEGTIVTLGKFVEDLWLCGIL